MKVLIVESPGKIKKIQSILGKDWLVKASVGHVRDLPLKELGVKSPEFTPQYAPTERGLKVLDELSKVVKNADVYLATDPDREGEAIAWHLQDALKLKNAKRVTFGAITEQDILAGVNNARTVDMHLVKAQEARRVLDRFCGYLVSPRLSNAGGEKLSTGRVQSPAVRLVVEREREIRAFTPTTHFGVELTFEAVENISEGWKATWLPHIGWLAEHQEYFLDAEEAKKLATLRKLHIDSYEEKESSVAPPAPFTTSTLQQAASNALKFNPKKTMELAQSLYQQGHITYMRTDSPNLSASAMEEIRNYCAEQSWPLSLTPRVWKSKAGAQEAHEAIRPTHIEVEDAGESADEKALYTLIRRRVLACQLADALYAVRVARLSATQGNKKAVFEARGRTLKTEGWKVVLAHDAATSDESEQEQENAVPKLAVGQYAMALDGKLLTKKTKAPSRFNEAALVRELERRGIGRPATYAAILDTMHTRAYVKAEKQYLVPTPTGEKAVDLLMPFFSFLDYGYTKEMEDVLDTVAVGDATYLETIACAYDTLLLELRKFDQKHSVPCPECRTPLRYIFNEAKGYDFFGCVSCENSYPNHNGKPGPKREKKEAPETSEHTCRFCHEHKLIRRQGVSQKTGKEYDFYACSGFPKCKGSFPIDEGGIPLWEKGKK